MHLSEMEKLAKEEANDPTWLMVSETYGCVSGCGSVEKQLGQKEESVSTNI